MAQTLPIAPGTSRARLFSALLMFVGLIALLLSWWNLYHAMTMPDIPRTTPYFMRGMAATAAVAICAVWLWIHARGKRWVSIVYAVLVLPAAWEFCRLAGMLFLR